MCTAISYNGNNHYFGRNLDLEHSYIETVTITPRNYPFKFRHTNENNKHYAIIGMAAIVDNFPLYYDATNEKGLSMAGLNFPGNAYYHPFVDSKINIASFELVPWILSQCASVANAQKLVEEINLTNDAFNEQLQPSPLHWIISDKDTSIVVEPRSGGIVIYENLIGVLTNNPPFDYHMLNLANYLNVTARQPSNRFSSKIDLPLNSRGMGGIGLPGDLSSSSRFVRAAFTKLNACKGNDENEDISQFFHILGSVFQQEGCVQIEDMYEKTIYSSCCNTDKGIYYYTTYHNNQITAVNLHHEKLDTNQIISYPLRLSQHIFNEN